MSYKQSVSLIELQIRKVVEADTAATKIERPNDFRVAVTKPKVYIHVHILIFMYSHIVNVFLEWVYTLYLSVFWYVRVLQEPTDHLNKFDNKSEILMQSRYKVNETFGQNQNYQDQES